MLKRDIEELKSTVRELAGAVSQLRAVVDAMAKETRVAESNARINKRVLHLLDKIYESNKAKATQATQGAEGEGAEGTAGPRDSAPGDVLEGQ